MKRPLMLVVLQIIVLRRVIWLRHLKRWIYKSGLTSKYDMLDFFANTSLIYLFFTGTQFGSCSLRKYAIIFCEKIVDSG